MEYYLIHKKSIPDVLSKARQYRSLLEPELAISICFDVFAIDENNQEALVIYILSLTDLYTHRETKVPEYKITIAIQKLKSNFQRFYYNGIYLERKAHFLLKNPMSESFAFDVFIEAIDYYKQAKSINDTRSDDAILRYNSCVRIIEEKNLVSREDNYDANFHNEA